MKPAIIRSVGWDRVPEHLATALTVKPCVVGTRG